MEGRVDFTREQLKFGKDQQDDIANLCHTILPSRTGLWTSPLMISRFDEYERRDIRAEKTRTSVLTPH